ncbi:hypothetical protein AX16_008147 [Volvariella volvacea WC 439]|nr:hypothetical protein AX16_008147 [Volvariella volvacea WC 439]
MLKKTFSLVLLMASTLNVVVAEPVVGRRQICGAHLSKEKMEVAEAHFEANQPITSFTSRTPVVNVHFHVISAGLELEDGNVPDSQIYDQMDVLNTDFAPSKIKFALKNITRTVNADWFQNIHYESPVQGEATAALRVGGASTLNVYTVGFQSEEASGLLGYATFPSEYKSNPLDDGVFLLYSTLPGGTAAPFNLGRTLTHEAGHWVGLFHTFEGGCKAPGDYVRDTPPEASPATGCPIGRDTCPGGGPDPIHNYMDYTDDACYNEFTPGQARRARAQIAVYRGIF